MIPAYFVLKAVYAVRARHHSPDINPVGGYRVPVPLGLQGVCDRKPYGIIAGVQMKHPVQYCSRKKNKASPLTGRAKKTIIKTGEKDTR